MASIRQFIRSLKTPPAPPALVLNCELGDGAVLHRTAIVYNAGERSKVSIGDHTHVSGILQVFADCGHIRIGKYAFVGDNSRIICAERVVIGDRVQIAHNCSIMDTDVHSLNPALRHMEYLSNINAGQRDINNVPKKAIVIEDDVWVACHCVILKGVRIGSGSVIGAGSVVHTDIPPGVLAYGNPVKVVRRI